MILALACRPPDEKVLYSELALLAIRRISTIRVAAVLDVAGLLIDDRPDAVELNWHRRLADVAGHELPARRRSHILVVLRSLFRYLKRRQRIFADPTARFTCPVTGGGR